jgi:hypothetical protein
VQFKKGHNRFVVVFPSLGIAIKFPIINFWAARCEACSELKLGGWKHFKTWLGYPMVVYWGFKWCIFRGFAANWGEFRFYHQTHNPLLQLQPTYLSLGFVNIQRYGETLQVESVDLWVQLVQIAQKDVWVDSHHFANPENFCLVDGKIRMLDYGSSKVQSFILKHGAAIIQRFDPKFRWKENED